MKKKLGKGGIFPVWNTSSLRHSRTAVVRLLEVLSWLWCHAVTYKKGNV